ncbi:YdbH domain-containing protein [Brevundimonas sp.]|uniref:intermembrane phospholipid transport protein YdbH family protein n=1 Tax=Brevundimonas sp. TaxID=1871086 RepID=UPI0035B02A37
MRRVLLGLLVFLLLLILATTVLWLARREAARQLLVGWLEDRGVAADIQVETVEFDRFVGRIVIGDPANPDVRVERVEVDYVVGVPWSSVGLGVTPSRIRLVRPMVRASWREGRLSFGSLDPIVEEFTQRPPDPTQRGPIVLIEQGEARLETEYGPVRALAEARLDDGRLMRLDARVPAAALKSGDIEGRLTDSRLTVRTSEGPRARQVVALTLTTGLEQFSTANSVGEDLALSLTAALPYPDRGILEAAQPVSAEIDLTAGGLRTPAGAFAGIEADLELSGRLRGWIETFRLDAETNGTVEAEALEAGFAEGRDTRAALNGLTLTVSRGEDGVTWRGQGPTRVTAGRMALNDAVFFDLTAASDAVLIGGRGAAWEATAPLSLAADRFTFGELNLRTVRGQVGFDLVNEGAAILSASGSMTAAGGAWPLFGPVGPEDVPELAAMKRALGDFRLSAPGFRLTADAEGSRVRLTRPVEVRPTNGGVLSVLAAERPIYAQAGAAPGGGAMRLVATRGAGLPQARFDIPRWSLTANGFTADLAGTAALDFGLARGLTVDTAGTLTQAGGVLTYRPSRCLDVTAAMLELGENDAVDVSGDFCPGTAPLVTVRDGAWRAQGRMAEVSADIPSFEVGVREAEGAVTVDGGPGTLDLVADVARAGLLDLAEPVRFRPLAASGQARLSDERWTGGFDLARLGTALGRAEFQHDGRLEAGGVTIALPQLTFAEGGLQPDDLTPLVAGFVDEPVNGQAAFSGRFDWAPAGVTSSGVVSTDGLDFVSPAGPVEGLAGRVELISLTPPITAPGQRLTVRSIGAFTPLTEVELDFELDADSLNVGAFELAVAGGVVRVEPIEYPLNGQGDWSGVLVLDRVQLGEVVAASDFADKVAMDAVVSGRLPFTYSREGGVRIRGGAIAAVQSGRLSINREALSEVAAGGGGEVSENTVQDLAYQAMENLAFDTMSADVNSLPEGRLGVLFSIKGRHDPPQRQDLRLSVFELISREFLNRELPLPSGTEIDLTLDTTINANQLASDFLALQRARRGENEPTAEPVEP